MPLVFLSLNRGRNWLQLKTVLLRVIVHVRLCLSDYRLLIRSRVLVRSCMMCCAIEWFSSCWLVLGTGVPACRMRVLALWATLLSVWWCSVMMSA